MIAQFVEPLLHSRLLVLVLALSVALIDVSLAPLTVTSGDLFDSANRIPLVVSHESFFVIETAVGLIAGGIASHAGCHVGAQLWVWVWTTVGHVQGVEEAADVTVESSAHTVSIALELVLPAKRRAQFSQIKSDSPLEGCNIGDVVVKPLVRELDQPVQTLLGCFWWNFLVLGGGGGCEDDCCDLKKRV